MRLLSLAREAAACVASTTRGFLLVRLLLDAAASVCDRRLMRLPPCAAVAYARPTQCLPGSSAVSPTLLICTHTRCYLQEERLSDMSNAEISICKEKLE
ncbi:hypothetical protein GW17_00040032 [Ensete ventricosum]|nr:hypothetical protein GW17_00040032 [Ensete ventricosum]